MTRAGIEPWSPGPLAKLPILGDIINKNRYNSLSTICLELHMVIILVILKMLFRINIL